MLYSESDTDAGVQSVLETISDEDSVDAQEIFTEAVMDTHEQEVYNHARAFFHVFEDLEGPFRRTFPDLYMQNSCEEPDLTDVLEGTCDGENTVTVDGSYVGQHALSSLSPLPSASVSSCKGYIGTEGLTMNSSAATRFIDAHPGKCLLIAVEPTMNRAELRKKHIEEYPGIDFYVGYINAEPTGWALLLSVDPAIVEKLQILYPDNRFATDDDRMMFCRERRTGRKGGLTLPERALTQRPNRALTKRMRDAAELARLIETVGGPLKAIFVALDVEAAVVLPGGIPLPLEMALIPLGTEHEFQSFHCFLHPGRVTDQATACALSCGYLKGSHFIPFRNASFLRRDYIEVARVLAPFVVSERVFFVNQGSTMDVHALRWVFGAASAMEGSEFPIPSLQEIYCFDIETVTEVLSRGGGDGGTNADDATACWYHSAMEQTISQDAMLDSHAHCALRDAGRLHNELRLLVGNFGSVQTNKH
ncbi:hypothetical protein TraAM80_04441 [Trypanosoma rangeli]|uniref:Uncharacterized protein n=1 Tax=Trypanosoma rangeli TaxID=5698 RepID=A0A3R7RJN8_TRYRA|nr:uncharacterized protein TraAM80_04441 [Trypanosoma rangeli]RNF05519.1 hypothetical protein TraAM80_04441 [Trypanosoma rangeli]|eukprot:RNF05519.1 hypothetical protein TraAM80_04441 [Trypanosoma rangeli]